MIANCDSPTDPIDAGQPPGSDCLLNMMSMRSDDVAAAGPVHPLSRRSFLRASALAAAAPALAGVLAACAPGTKSSSKTDRPLTIGWTSDIDTLNPMTAETSEAVEVLQLIYDRLFEYSVDLKPEPSLAKTATVSADGKTITYALRDDVTWHDGTKFTADDVVYTYSFIHKSSISEYAQFLIDLTSITAKDDTTVVAEFKRPQALDPSIIVPILPKHIWGKLSATQVQKFTNSKPVGTGPFTFDFWKQGQSVQITRNDKWWGTKPAVGSVTWLLYSNDDVMAQGLKNGDVDILLQVPPTVFQGLKGAKGLTSLSLKSFSFHHIGMNVYSTPKSKGNPLLLNKSIRQALSCAVSREQLVQLALAGYGVPGSVLLPPAFGDWQYQVTDAEKLDNDPAKAEQLLDAAGFTQKDGSGIRQNAAGDRLSFRLIAIEDTTVDVRAGQLFEIAAKKVGIELTLTTLDSNTLSNTVYNDKDPDWDIFVWGWDSEVDDPDYLLGVPLTSQIGDNNDVGYSNTTFDQLYDEQATELDRTKRLDLVHQMQALYYDDCAYIVMWYQDKLQSYRTDSWKGWTQTPGGMIFNFTRDNYLRITPA
jgi:peptide/nickel transport system substrate-binding protein